jgi:hypothetical protein
MPISPHVLTVNSSVVHEAIEYVHTLLRIITSIALAKSIHGSSRLLSLQESERQSPTKHNPSLLASTLDEHVLAPFYVVCDFIWRSLGSIFKGVTVTIVQQRVIHCEGYHSSEVYSVLYQSHGLRLVQPKSFRNTD